jgi:hypothetical protein
MNRDLNLYRICDTCVQGDIAPPPSCVPASASCRGCTGARDVGRGSSAERRGSFDIIELPTSAADAAMRQRRKSRQDDRGMSAADQHIRRMRSRRGVITTGNLDDDEPEESPVEPIAASTERARSVPASVAARRDRCDGRASVSVVRRASNPNCCCSKSEIIPEVARADGVRGPGNMHRAQSMVGMYLKGAVQHSHLSAHGS